MKQLAQRSGMPQQTVTHFVSSMGTTGTIMGTSRFLKEQRESIQIVGVQPEDGSAIPGDGVGPQSSYRKSKAIASTRSST